MSESSISLAVVTGGAGGIGSATSRLLHEAGHELLVQFHEGYRPQAEALREELGEACHLVEADFAEMSGVDAVVGAVDGLLAQRPELSVGALVNCAALLLGPSFDDATPEAYDVFFAVNTRAPFFLSQRLAARMGPGSSIVNISSAGVHFSNPDDIVYTMSKAAIESMTKNMAEAVAPRGIRVNAVIPGFTDNGHPAFGDPGIREILSSFSVLGGVAEPKTVAEAIVFLASDAAKRCTGSILDVSGGSTLGARSDLGKALRDRLSGRA